MSDQLISGKGLGRVRKQVAQILPSRTPHRPTRQVRPQLPLPDHAPTRSGRLARNTKRQREILTALEIREPAQILDYELPTPVE